MENEEDQFDREQRRRRIWLETANMDMDAQFGLAELALSAIPKSDPLWHQIKTTVRRLKDVHIERPGTHDEKVEVEHEWINLLVKCRTRIQ